MSLRGMQKGRPPAIHGTVAAEGSASDELPLDAVYHLLQNERRRGVISYLDDHEAPVTRSEVAEQVAAWENGTDVDGIDSQERKRVYIALHQIHLPKLDDAGVLEYDPDRGTITPRPLLEQVNEIIETTSGVNETRATPTPGPAPDREEATAETGSLGFTVFGLLPGVALGFLLGNLLVGIGTGVVLLAAAIALVAAVAIVVRNGTGTDV